MPVDIAEVTGFHLESAPESALLTCSLHCVGSAACVNHRSVGIVPAYMVDICQGLDIGG